MRKVPLLDSETQRSLYNQADAALRNGMWQLPRIVSPLTEAEVHFMRTHTLDQLIAPQRQPMNPFVGFLVQIVASVASDLASQAFENAMQPKVQEPVASASHDLKKPVLQNIPQHQPQKSVSNPENHAQTTLTHSETKNCVRACEEPKYASEKNPEIAHMSKAVEGKLKGLVSKGVSVEISRHISDPETARLYGNVKNALGAGIAAGTFMNKVEEGGFVFATTELVKNTLIDQFAKHTANGLSKIVMSSNPAGLSVVISLAIKDVFTATETAPDYHDTRPRACQPYEMPKISGIPNLDMPYPTLRAQH